jgi:hypothetical protein
MRKAQQLNKERCGLYCLALRRIEECEKIKGEMISFPIVFQSLCRSFSIKKREAWEILFILREFGAIKFVPTRGVILQ